MGSDIVVALIAGAVGFASGTGSWLLGPRVRAWVDQGVRVRGARDAYAPPLLRAGYDLQSRCANIVGGSFLRAYGGSDPRAEDAVRSTVWLVAQYFAWVEILRLEIQFLDFRKARRNRRVQQAIHEVSSAFASDAGGTCAHMQPMVFRATQRAIGELMTVVDDTEGATRRRAPLGYAAFAERMAADAAFAAWLRPLEEGVRELADDPDPVHDRLIAVQWALIDLIEALDPHRRRYPKQRTREKLEQPGGDNAIASR